MLQVYTSRCFEVRDGSSNSQRKSLRSGISQGCQLSPFLFLFVMVMTAVLTDTVNQLPLPEREVIGNKCLAELLYAGDTLLLGISAALAASRVQGQILA